MRPWKSPVAMRIPREIAPQGHFFGLRPQGATPACALVRNDHLN